MFDWQEYYLLARVLLSQADSSPHKEAMLRSAVSRAYYAAFHRACDYLREVNEYPTRQQFEGSRRETHRFLISIFDDAINLLAKWRSVLSGWQLGSRPIGDAECDAVRYQAERLLLLRAELSAFTVLCIQKGIFSKGEFQQAVIDECALTQNDLENKFPGFKANETGMSMDVEKAAKTTKNWRK